MHYPQDVKLTTEEIYILSNGDNPCVHVFSFAGNELRSFITHGHNVGMQVRRASSFCLDSEKNLIIGDWFDHCIKVFSPNGTFLHTIVDRQHFTGLVSPKGIALTQQLKLVVIAPANALQFEIYSS